MPHQKTSGVLKLAVKYFGMIFGGLFLIAFCALYVFEDSLQNLRQSELKAKEMEVISLESSAMRREINQVISDLQYLVEIYQNSHRLLDRESRLRRDWLIFGATHESYDRVRLLDPAGDEKIHILRKNGQVRILPDKELKNRSDRPFFQGTIHLKKGQVFVSKFDLTRQDGAVQMPPLPVIRFASPVFDDSSEPSGMILLNYHGQELIDYFKEISRNSTGHVSLLNTDGYWISGPNRADDFAFDQPNGQDRSFKARYPQEWQAMQSSSGHVLSENGLFSFSDLVLPDRMSDASNSSQKRDVSMAEKKWKVVSHVGASSAAGQMLLLSGFPKYRSVLEKHALFFFFLLVLSSILTMLFTQSQIARRKIRYFSEYDTLTGLYNRRAGFERLGQDLENQRKKPQPLSIGFLDINGLKEVNDHLGHEAGDQLIQTVVLIARRHLLPPHYMMRIGGDEFVMVFPETALEEAERLWKKITEDFERLNREDSRAYQIFVSHGIVQAHCQELDALVQMADEKMYQEKARLKKSFPVLSSHHGPV